jgi:hypothetical protein
VNLINRRRTERFQLPPMYTSVAVEAADGRVLRGHSYDISEDGVQFELDHPLPPGTPITIEIKLPGPGVLPIAASARIVWTDDSEPGPARMAAEFSGFADQCDRDLLMHEICSGRFLRAA